MANIRTIDYKGFNHATGSQATGSGFLIWSGSMELSKSGQSHTNTNYYGVGMELVNDSASYLRYRTKTGSSAGAGSELEIVTPKFFLGSPSSFISGSGTGEIAISSSNFELTNQGSVTMLGTITAEAGGTIGGFDIGSTYLSTTTFQLSSSQNTNDPASFISSSNFKVSAGGKITASSGLIGGWELVGNTLYSRDGNDRMVISSDPTETFGSDISSYSAFASEFFDKPSIIVWSSHNDFMANFGNIYKNKSYNGIALFEDYTTNSKVFEVSKHYSTQAFIAQIAGWSFTTESFNGGRMHMNKQGYISSSGVGGWVISSSNAAADPVGFISSSVFKVSADGRVTASNIRVLGVISSSEGNIGGLTIGSSAISTTAFQISSSLNTNDPVSFISSSDFKVSADGRITASAGKIASWTIDGDILKSNNSSITDISLGNAQGMLLDGGSTPMIYMNPGNGSANENVKMFFNASDDFGLLAKAGSSTPVFELGSTNQIAGWTFDNEQLTGGNLILNKNGTIQTSDYASNLMGFQLSAVSGGYLEVENAKIRGTLATAVFEKESVNAVGGQLYVANSTVLTSSATHPAVTYSVHDTTMSVENVTGFTHGEVLSIKKVSTTGFTTEYVQVNSSSRESLSSETNFAGNLMVTRSLGFTGGSVVNGNSGSLGGTPANSQSYSGSQVIVSTGKLGTGFIRLNANPNDTTTPYIDIVERTGSGIYDIELKARLGDLSGVASTGPVPASPGFGLFSENVYLSGTITASAGKIAGFSIDGNTLTATDFTLDASGKRLTLGSGDDIFIADGDEGIQLGDATFADAPFSVTKAGVLKAESGTVGGWTIGSTGIYSKDTDGGVWLSGGTKTIRVITGSAIQTDIIQIGEIDTDKFGILGKKLGTNTTVFKLGEDGNEIAGFTFDEGKFAQGSVFHISTSTDTTDPAGFISSSAFKVSPDGRITGSQVDFSGGNIGGWALSSTALEADGITINSAGNRVKVYAHSANDYVDMYYTSGASYGIVGKNSGNTIFKLGSDNEIAGWSFTQYALEGGSMMINRGGFISSSGAAVNTTGWKISSSADADDIGGFISSSGFNVSPEGLVEAVNFSETMVVVNEDNSASYFANDNNYSGTSDGVRLLFDGSGGGKVTMNMQLDTVPWHSSQGQKPISDIRVPLGSSNTKQQVNLIINVSGVEFTDDGNIAPDIDDYLSR